jgi:hypothetical protein
MGIFSSTKPVITQREAKEIENRLYSEHGFNQKKIEVVREIIKPHLDDAEQYGDPVGVSPNEVKEIDENLEKGAADRVYNVKLSDPEKMVVEKLLDDYLKLRK